MVHVDHTTMGGFPKTRLLDNQEGADSADTERYVFGKLSDRCFQRRPFWHRHYSNYSNYSNYYHCGDIDHGESTQGGVIV